MYSLRVRGGGDRKKDEEEGVKANFNYYITFILTYHVYPMCGYNPSSSNLWKEFGVEAQINQCG